MSTTANKNTLLEVENLSLMVENKLILDKISLTLNSGEALSVIGASGSGKSTLLKTIMGLLPHGGHIIGGDIRFKGVSLLKNRHELRNFLGKEIAMVFQHPGNYLNPSMRIRRQYDNFLRAHAMPIKEREGCMADALRAVGFVEPARILDAYPFQISGGERQRVAIAITLSFSPKLILLDEPTSALDPVAVINFLDRMKAYQQKGTSLIFVTHHIKAGGYLGDRLLILKAGQVVETGETSLVMNTPVAPYTRELLDAVMEVS